MKTLPILCLVLLACSDRYPNVDEDASSAADASGEEDATIGGTDASPTSCTCVALGSDFQQPIGTLATVELPSMEVETDRIPHAISNDPGVYVAGGRVFVVNRFGADNVTVINPSNWTVIGQFSTGGGTNPQDLALLGNKLYVSLYEIAEVQVWDLTDTFQDPVRIDLDDWLAGNDDGITPEAASLHVVGNQVYVALQHMHRASSGWTPLRNGRVLVIDSVSDEVVDEFDLTTANPGGFRALGADLGVVSTVFDETFTPTASCLERIVLDDPPGSTGCILDMEMAGGAIGGFVPTSDTELHVLITKPDWTTELSRVVIGGSDAPTPIIGSDLAPGDFAYCAPTNQIIFADRNVGALRVYDLDDGAIVSPPAGLDIGLPPVFGGGLSCF